MINPKYYNDIKQFPKEFAIGFELARAIKINGEFNRVVLCGMGGSSSYPSLINDYLATDSSIKLTIELDKDYSLPNNSDDKVLFIISSYSGNTEEALTCLDEVIKRGFNYCVVSAGGRLLERAKNSGVAYVQIPSGIQPRLSTGYFIGAVLKVLSNMNLIPDKEAEVTAIAAKTAVAEDQAKILAQKLVGKLPMLYATDNIKSLAYLAKIKFNENSKVQAFWNYFPELNHNEMVGFTKLVTDPFFIIFKSKFSNPRNAKRIEVFKKLMDAKGLTTEIIDLKGDSILEEILNGYQFIDFVTYYLAEAYGIDPEPVAMVEEFKKMIES